jgi:hypothetical protein
MRFIFVVIILGAVWFYFFGADSEGRYNAGYDDGYASGYNTACQIRATLIEGDFEDADYARGFSRGQSDGIVQCNRDRTKN